MRPAPSAFRRPAPTTGRRRRSTGRWSPATASGPSRRPRRSPVRPGDRAHGRRARCSACWPPTSGVTQLQLSQGRIDLHVRRVGPGETIEVDTPNLAFVARAPGDYRIIVAPDGGSTDVAVAARRAATCTATATRYKLARARATASPARTWTTWVRLPIQPYDDFDRWALARDQRFERAQSAPLRAGRRGRLRRPGRQRRLARRARLRHGVGTDPRRRRLGAVPHRPLGLDRPVGLDLDRRPALGLCRFALRPLGATSTDRWAWVPSPRRERAVYAPALVAFVGAALAFGGGNDGPGVGWFPLAPREAYRPSYHASPAYITRINVSNTAVPARHAGARLARPGDGALCQSRHAGRAGRDARGPVCPGRAGQPRRPGAGAALRDERAAWWPRRRYGRNSLAASAPRRHAACRRQRRAAASPSPAACRTAWLATCVTVRRCRLDNLLVRPRAHAARRGPRRAARPCACCAQPRSRARRCRRRTAMAVHSLPAGRGRMALAERAVQCVPTRQCSAHP